MILRSFVQVLSVVASSVLTPPQAAILPALRYPPCGPLHISILRCTGNGPSPSAECTSPLFAPRLVGGMSQCLFSALGSTNWRWGIGISPSPFQKYGTVHPRPLTVQPMFCTLRGPRTNLRVNRYSSCKWMRTPCRMRFCRRSMPERQKRVIWSRHFRRHLDFPFHELLEKERMSTRVHWVPPTSLQRLVG